MDIKKLISLFTKRQKREGRVVLFLIIIRSLLDFVGIAGIISVLYFIIERKYTTFIWLIILSGILLIIIKNLAAYAIDNYCTKWHLSLYRHFSSELFHRYYQSGLIFIRDKGYTDLTYETNSICFSFSMGFISTIFQSIGKALLVIIFFIPFAIYSPLVAALFLLVALPFMWLYMYLIRTRIATIGEEESNAKKEQWKTVMESFRGYVDIETGRAFRVFDERFNTGMDTIISGRLKLMKFQQLPSGLMEVCTVCLLSIIVYIARSEQEMVLFFGAISVGALKILPNIKFVFAGLSQIRNFAFTADIIYDGLNLPIDAESSLHPNPVFDNSLIIKDISYSYDKKTDVISNLDFQINKGDFIGIRGASGIGKSTLLNILLGFIKPDKGEVLIDNIPLSTLNISQWHKMAGYVPQEVFIMNGSIAENITFGIEAGDTGCDRLNSILEVTHLKEWTDTLPDGINSSIGENGCRISVGQKQRIGIARALYKDARILFLDEATSALDETTEEKIMDMIYNLPENGYDITLVIVSHKQKPMSRCSRIIEIN